MPSTQMSLGKITCEQAGKFLANLAQMTASGTKRWDVFADLATSIVQQAYDAGAASARPDDR